MLFRQMFDSVSGTYSYLLASRPGGEALILDPVLEKVDRYCQLLRELDLKLVKAVDTHLHADHVTGLGELRDRTHCMTVMGDQTKADVVAMRVADGDKVTIEGLSLAVMYTPGHTDDSYSYLMGDRVFTGDTLLIRGTGRTDFQNGSSRAQYDSIFNRLLKLRSEEHTSELQSHSDLVCRLLLEKKKKHTPTEHNTKNHTTYNISKLNQSTNTSTTNKHHKTPPTKCRSSFHYLLKRRPRLPTSAP